MQRFRKRKPRRSSPAPVRRRGLAVERSRAARPFLRLLAERLLGGPRRHAVVVSCAGVQFLAAVVKALLLCLGDTGELRSEKRSAKRSSAATSSTIRTPARLSRCGWHILSFGSTALAGSRQRHWFIERSVGPVESYAVVAFVTQAICRPPCRHGQLCVGSHLSKARH